LSYRSSVLVCDEIFFCSEIDNPIAVPVTVVQTPETAQIIEIFS
jgi:hypothetical protein